MGRAQPIWLNKDGRFLQWAGLELKVSSVLLEVDLLFVEKDQFTNL